jgi:phosphoribosyl-dephospho-CoA transferase
MTAGVRARTHDLIRLRSPSTLLVDGATPPWVEPALHRGPWVVVRRAAAPERLVPVGVRGVERSQRFAAFVTAAAISQRVTPAELAASLHAIDESRRAASPAFVALSRVAPLLASSGHTWGPGGSVGFEIASGVPTASASSDLDVIVHCDARLGSSAARRLLVALAEAARPVRIDVLLETPRGGVLLADLVASPTRILVRTADGPRLCSDPWGNGEAPCALAPCRVGS